MGSTAAGLPYPDPDDLVADVDLAIKALAEAIAAPVVTSTAGVVMSAGWSTPVVRLRLLNGGSMARLHLEATRSGATITTAANGNLSPDSPILTLPVTWWPVRVQYVAAGKHALGSWQSHIDAVGVWSVTAGPPSMPINTGDTLIAQQIIDLT